MFRFRKRVVLDDVDLTTAVPFEGTDSSFSDVTPSLRLGCEDVLS